MPECDYIGKRFGTRVCLSVRSKGNGKLLVLRCDCGLEVECTVVYAKKHGCRSCAKKKHGHRPAGGNSPEYGSWRKMIDRCLNKNHQAFMLYGGRGITVCDKWRRFDGFFEDMGNRPPGTSLDRIDNNKGYCKENCRWATAREQCRNKRDNVYLEKDGEVRCLSEWIELLKLTPSVVAYRKRKGWPKELWLEPRGTKPTGLALKG